jgi:hypothetical protein
VNKEEKKKQKRSFVFVVKTGGKVRGGKYLFSFLLFSLKIKKII